MQTVKRREDSMQICNLVKMAEVLFVVRHFELACEQPAVRKERAKEKETHYNGQGF